MAVISCISLFFLQTRETRRARAHARPRNEKPGAACHPGFWRSLGEYAFLEDSRYRSQAKNGLPLSPEISEEIVGYALRSAKTAGDSRSSALRPITA